jgi:hypothetical protein
MGTYVDSKILRARKAYRCDYFHGHTISKGERYLRYAAGQRNRVPVCLKCAGSVKYASGVMYYRCAAVQKLVIDQQERA